MMKPEQCDKMASRKDSFDSEATSSPPDMEVGDNVQLRGFTGAFSCYNGLTGILKQLGDNQTCLVEVQMPGCTGVSEIRVKASEVRVYDDDSEDDERVDYWKQAFVTHAVGTHVRIEGLPGGASKFNGKVGIITQILMTGLRCVHVSDLPNDPIVGPSNLQVLTSAEIDDMDSQ